MMGKLIKCIASAPAAALGVVIGGRFEPLRSLTCGYFAKNAFLENLKIFDLRYFSTVCEISS